MIITHQKGRGTKIHLLIDDEYKITTDIDFWADNYIKDGTDISDDEWQTLVVKINYKRAMNKCADLLSRRDHSVKELRDKLLRTVDEVSADKAINRMIELGYLDDEKYARSLIKYLIEIKKYSLSRIKQECYKRGITREIYDDLLDDIEIDNVCSCEDIIRAKYMMKLAQDGGRDKVIAAMMRRGFSYSDIKSALYRLQCDDDDFDI